MSNQLLITIKLKVCLVSALHYSYKITSSFFLKVNPDLMFELFFEMVKSFFWRDEEVKTNVAFYVMTRPKILDMAGSNIPDMAGRKTRRRRTRASIAKRYAFHVNTIAVLLLKNVSLLDAEKYKTTVQKQ